MKKITLFILTLCFSFASYAQFPETFEGISFPPANWASFVGTNGLGNVENWKSQGFETGNTTAVCVWEILAAGQRSEDWLVTPQVAITTANNFLSFQGVDSGSQEYGSIYTIRVSTASQTTHADFTIIDTQDESQIAHSNSTMVGSERIIDLSAYIGQSIYVAFVLEQNDGDLWRIDNVDFIGGCLDPTVTFDAFTQTTADISMNTVGDYEIEWGEYPYTQGSGGSTATVTAGDSYQFTGLTAGISYTAFVRKNCGSGDLSDYVEVTVGTSPSNLNTLPYSEDLEPDANQALLLNFGLSFAGTGGWSFSQDDTTDGNTANDFANDGIACVFSNNTSATTDTDAKIYIGPFTLTTANAYTFSFSQRNVAASDTDRPNKDIDIIVTTSNDGTSDTVLLALNDLENTNHILRTATFTPTTDGEYYFGIHDRSSFLSTATVGNAVFADSFALSSMPLSIDEFNQNTVTNYYNENLKTLNLESSGVAFTGIEIYSTLGQSVISKSLTNTSESINLAALTDGVYLAKITVGENTKTIKFIKN